jgi:hypothetical protein
VTKQAAATRPSCLKGVVALLLSSSHMRVTSYVS